MVYHHFSAWFCFTPLYFLTKGRSYVHFFRGCVHLLIIPILQKMVTVWHVLFCQNNEKIFGECRQLKKSKYYANITQTREVVRMTMIRIRALMEPYTDFTVYIDNM